MNAGAKASAIIPLGIEFNKIITEIILNVFFRIRYVIYYVRN